MKEMASFWGLSAIVALLPFIPVPAIIAVPLFIAWCILVSVKIGAMPALAGGTLFLTIWYLLFSLSPAVISVVVVLISIATTVKSVRSPNVFSGGIDTRIDLYSGCLFAGVLLGDGIILRTLLIGRTSMALPSPWNVLPVSIFFLFFAASFILLLLSREKNRTLFIIASSIHIFSALSVASIVYAVGFGFDAFLHRAAEDALYKTGLILPKTPLYAGQYVLIASLAHLTHLPLKLIDVWLVPVLSAIALPWAFLNRSSPRLTLAPVFLLLFPFAGLTFTVPYNLTVVYALWSITQWRDIRDNTEPAPYRKAGMILLAILGVFTHPLLGLPMAIATGYVMCTKKSRLHLAIACTILIGISVPALMFFYNHLQGVPLATMNPFTRLDYFFGLFRDPFAPAFGPMGHYWDLFYSWDFSLPLLISIITIPLVFFLGEEPDKTCARYLEILTLGIFIIAFLLSTLFVFKDVIVFEQFEYALRLIHVLPLLLSPLAAVLIMRLLEKSKRWQITSLGILALPALAMTASWYFSYPQENPKVQIAGPSVSASDIMAVHKIDEDAKGEPYIVLSNQMTSAAAIEEFGFRDYVESDAGKILWYAIPTGGELYKFYSDMTYWQPRRDVAEEAGAFTHVHLVYYLVYRYWPGYEYIANLAGKDADAIMRINKGDILVFKFTTPK